MTLVLRCPACDQAHGFDHIPVGVRCTCGSMLPAPEVDWGFEWVEECPACRASGVRRVGDTMSLCPRCEGACYVPHECPEAA